MTETKPMNRIMIYGPRRNPNTGKEATISARQVIVFKPGPPGRASKPGSEAAFGWNPTQQCLLVS
jgi:hypothetical protein